MLDHLGADRKAFLFFAEDVVVFDQLLLSCLNGKIGLADGNHLFARVAVLGDEVAGIARELVVLDLALGALAGLDHFRGLTKMILTCGSRSIPRHFRPLYCNREVFPAPVSQKLHDVARIPELDAAFRVDVRQVVQRQLTPLDVVQLHERPPFPPLQRTRPRPHVGGLWGSSVCSEDIADVVRATRRPPPSMGIPHKAVRRPKGSIRTGSFR